MNKSKGFTLAELLIVVAIISVLVGISIPVFNTQLEKSRESKDLANARSVYAEVLHAAIAGETTPDPSSGVIYQNGVWRKSFNLEQKEAGWQTKLPVSIGEVSSGENGEGNDNWVGVPTKSGQCVVYYYDGIGTVITWDMNFGKILNEITVNNSEVSSSYRNKSVASLVESFGVLDSSGSTGKWFSNEIKKIVGLNNADSFAYTVIKSKEANEENVYCIYISTERELGMSGFTSGALSGQTIRTIGYKYDISSGELIAVGPEVDLPTRGGNSKQEKMDTDQYYFY